MGISLEKNSVLTSLDLSCMCCWRWNELHLSYVIVGNCIEDKGAKSLVDSLEKNLVLTSLDLGRMC